jgi:hypothetical protein
MIWTIAVIMFIALGFAGWFLLRRRAAAPDPDEFGASHERFAVPTMSEAPRVILHLPSSHPHFQFTCDIEFRYAERTNPPQGLRPRQGSVEWALYNAVKDLSARFPLTRKDQLKYELTGALRSTVELQGGRFVVWGECKGVEADPVEIEIVTQGYQEDVEHERMRRRIEFLGKVFESPRTSTMWWLSQNTDQVDQVEEKSELFYQVDRRLNPDNNTPEATVGKDLSEFVERADASGRAAIGRTLHRFYKDHKQERRAKEALRLLPKSDAVSEESEEESAD